MTLESIIQDLGLPGITLGVVLEGEGVSFLGGVLAHRGLFAFEAVAIAATLGALIVDQMLFFAGRYAGRIGPVHRALGHPAAQVLNEKLDQHQSKVILGFRFIYGMKTVGALLIGSSPVSWQRFAILDLVAVVVWAHVWVAMGYGAGQAIEAMFGKLHLNWHIVIAVGVFLLVALGLWYARRREIGKESGAP